MTNSTTPKICRRGFIAGSSALILQGILDPSSLIASTSGRLTICDVLQDESLKPVHIKQIVAQEAPDLVDIIKFERDKSVAIRYGYALIDRLYADERFAQEVNSKIRDKGFIKQLVKDYSKDIRFRGKPKSEILDFIDSSQGFFEVMDALKQKSIRDMREKVNSAPAITFSYSYDFGQGIMPRVYIFSTVYEPNDFMLGSIRRQMPATDEYVTAVVNHEASHARIRMEKLSLDDSLVINSSNWSSVNSNVFEFVNETTCWLRAMNRLQEATGEKKSHFPFHPVYAYLALQVLELREYYQNKLKREKLDGFSQRLAERQKEIISRELPSQSLARASLLFYSDPFSRYGCDQRTFKFSSGTP